MLKKPLIHILFYLVGYLAFYVAGKIEPTDLAGPGLDIPVLAVFFILILYLFVKNILTAYEAVSTKVVIAAIHVVGTCLMLWMLTLPKSYYR